MKLQDSGTATFFRRTPQNLCVAYVVDRDSSQNSRRSAFARILTGFVVSYAGIPVVVNAKSEHIDLDFNQHQIMVRDPKGCMITQPCCLT
jgi:hypothetical protein